MTDTLIARLESADGPSGSLLLEAAKAVWVWNCVPTGVNPDVWVKRWNRFHRMLDAEAWTSAAGMLVPDGWRPYSADMSVQGRTRFLIEGPKTQRSTDDDGEKCAGNDWYAQGVATTPALALAAAALKARGV